MDFPKPIEDKRFLGLIVVFYTLFSVDPEMPTLNLCIFNNDLGEFDVSSWLFSQLISEMFILLLSWQSCGITSNRLLKSIFYAIMIDSGVTALFALLFGYYTSVGILLLRNLFTCLAMFYAYFILHEKK